MNKEVYEKNIVAFEKRYGKYEKIINNKYESKIEQCKNGLITLRIDVDGRKVYLNSKYNPINEATDYYKDFKKVKHGSVIFVFGFGLSYYIESLYEKIKTRATISVYEPDKEIFDIVMKNIDICKILENKNISIIFNPKYIVGEIQNCYYMIENTPVYKELYLEEYKEFMEKLKNTLEREKINFNTTEFYKDLWIRNSFHNLKSILNAYKMSDFKDTFKGKPVIIVGAGPSLIKNIHLLKEIKGKVCIISAFSASKVLEKNGIKPDFIATIDSLQYGISEFEANIPLIFDVSCNSELLEKHKVNKILSFRGDKFFEYILGNDIQKDNIIPGGTVTYFAMESARYLGATEIILIGQDFSWTKDAIHAKGSVHNDKLYGYKKYHHYNMPVEDMYGNIVYTNDSFMNYKKSFEEYIKNPPESIKLIQASEGGLQIEGAETRTLRECIDIYCKDKFCNIEKIINNKFKENSIICEDTKEVFDRVKKTYDEICELKKITKKAVDLSKKILKNVKYSTSGFYKNNKLIKRLDGIDEKIKENRIILSLMKSYIYDITSYFVIDEVEDENINFALMNKRIYTTIDETLEKLINIIKEEMHYEN